jgi:hypothetical protein
MMRLVLAPKPIEEIMKNSSNREIENRVKNTYENHENENIVAQDRR